MIMRYGLLRRLRRGIRITCYLTFACDYNCSYCLMNFPGNGQPKAKMSSLDEWKEYINLIPSSIQEIYISGGEPTLVPYFKEFTEWALNKGILVTVFSNMSDSAVAELSKLEETVRLRILGSYHPSQQELSNFINNCNSIKNRVDVLEIKFDENTKKNVPFSKWKPVTNKDQMRTKKMFRISPDLLMFLTCFDMYKYLTKNKTK